MNGSAVQCKICIMNFTQDDDGVCLNCQDAIQAGRRLGKSLDDVTHERRSEMADYFSISIDDIVGRASYYMI